jgi:hypothetical protein
MTSLVSADIVTMVTNKVNELMRQNHESRQFIHLKYCPAAKGRAASFPEGFI